VILDDKFLNLVKEAKSFRELEKTTGVCRRQLKKTLDECSVDYSHFIYYNDYNDQTYGYLTIKKTVSEKKSGYTRKYAICDCLCGKTDVKKRFENVVTLRSPSCGCLSKNRPSMCGEGNPAFNGCGKFRGVHFTQIKRQAKRRKIEFAVTKEYLWELYKKQNGKCALSGMDIWFGRIHYSLETTCSLDRRDSNKGYTEGNVQWTHKDINKLKHDFDESYFIKLCKQVANTN
jgi:hypothetical protein